jgi:hypothetical protein
MSDAIVVDATAAHVAYLYGVDVSRPGWFSTDVLSILVVQDYTFI